MEGRLSMQGLDTLSSLQQIQKDLESRKNALEQG